MKRIKLCLVLGLSLLFLIASRLGAVTETNFAAAGISQPWLSLGTDVRDAGLAGAVATLSEGDAALQDNPAGIEAIVDPELSLSHIEWDTTLGLREETLSYGHRLGDGAAAASFRYFSYGTFTNLDANGAPLGSSSDDAYAGSFGYAQAYFSDALRLGAALTGSQEVLSGISDSVYGGSLGASYFAPLGLRIAAAGVNLGIGGSSGTAPGYERVGIGWATKRKNFQIDGDWIHPLQGDGSLAAGAEWTFADSYSLRGGYRFAQGEGSEENSGLALGAGLKFGDIRIDYAFVPTTDFGNSQQIGATLYFGGALFGGQIVIEAPGNTAQAQAFYEEGMSDYKNSDWGGAKVQLNNALKLRPDLPEAAQVKITLLEVDKRLEAAKAAGNTSETKALFLRKLDEARKEYDAGQLVPALNKLDEIFQFDASLSEAVALRGKIQKDLSDKVTGLKNEAVQALQDGDLVVGVSKYRAVLALVPDDQETIDRLRKMSPRIFDEIRRLHHEGIDAYVNGDIDRALTVWQQAIDLDPQDPQNIKRDMDKARKLKELRAP